MSTIKWKRTVATSGLIVLLLAILACACPLPFFGGPTATPSFTPTPTFTPTPLAKPGDYGDAPDGDRNQDTGYYAPTGGPFFMTYDSAGVGAHFPTVGEDPIPGPFTIDVDEFWIGPLFGGSSADIPSIEEDAIDPFDPDGLPNIAINGNGADCDSENGTHSPISTDCMPVPAYSIPMNARLLIMFGYPPLGVWITSVTASETMSYTGPIVWNLAIDLNQDGRWGSTEWIARDVPVSLSPGETVTLISPAFRLSTSGSPWGRINFPFWVRSMVTSESIQEIFGPVDWDGRGPEDGFNVGEVEDYFVEWQPLGQRFPNQEPDPEPLRSCSTTSISEDIIAALPRARDPWNILELQPGANVESVDVAVVEDSTVGGFTFIEKIELELAIRKQISSGENEFDVVFNENGVFQVSPDMISPHGVYMYFGANLREPSMCSGSAPVHLNWGYYTNFMNAPPYSVYGYYDVTASFFGGDYSHYIFAMLQNINKMLAEEGSIIFSGDPPFVTVTGELNPDDGSFIADGRGVVAGYADIAVTFDGTLSEEGLNGLYTMGAEGGLPGGEPIIYEIIGTKADETGEEPAELLDGVIDGIDAFIQVFNSAFEDGDPEPLYQLLHPAVVELYGEEACQAYLDTIVETPTELEYIDATWVGDWDWERDGVATPVNFAFAVDVNFAADGQTTEQEMHLTLPGDELGALVHRLR